MFILCFDDMQWINPHPREILPPVPLFIYGWTAYDASIQVKLYLKNPAPITILSSIFWLRNFNIILGLFLCCSIGDLTRVQRKTTSVSISGCDPLLFHTI